MKRSLLCLLLPFFYSCLSGQKNCAQEDYERRVLLLHPIQHITANEHFAFQGHLTLTGSHVGTVVPVSAFPAGHHFPVAASGNTDTVVTHPVPEKIIIPVVVHVLWNSKAQNISDAQVLSQIEVLNKDYSGTNTDRNKIPSYFSALAADCGITFALAKTDPQGRATTGIVHKQTSISVFGFDDKAKSNASNGDDAWNAANYLNIWVCNLESGISGYSSTPGGPREADGVVISTAVFGTLNINGPFNKGRTATHEIGHWLNLRHVWGDADCGDDMVDDTPTQQGPNRGCNSGEKFTCGSTAHGDMYMNYMDFSDDACMYMFTLGQRQRMRVLFEAGGLRNSILFSNGLKGDGLPVADTVAGNQAAFDLFLYPNPATTSLTIQSTGNSNSIGKKIYICNYLGQTIKAVMCTSKLQQLDISGLSPGLYFIKMEGTQTSSTKKFVKQ
jgi:hypothetical protein